jgi:hypothetical protein
MRVIGTCGNCGGPVMVPEIWSGTMPPTPACATCGARAKASHGPTIPMEPAPKRIATRLDVVATNGCKATVETLAARGEKGVRS